MHFIKGLAHWILAFYGAHELPALFLFLVVEEAGVPLPIPGDSLVALSGTRSHHPVAGFVIILLSTAGVFLGSTILYWVMRRGGRPLLERYGKYMHLHPHRLERIEAWFRKHGAVAIIIGRLIPGLRIPTTVMSGISEVPYAVFLPSTLFAAMVWSLFYFYIGVALEKSWRHIVAFFTGFADVATDWLTVIFFLTIALSVWIYYLWQKRNRNSSSATFASIEE